jgi:hypothetical protein
MNMKLIDEIEKLLDMDNYNTRLNYQTWDKGDCSRVGIVLVLFKQTIEEEIKELIAIK